MQGVILLVSVFALALLLTGRIRNIADRRRLIDVPVDRSAHSQPTPTGGGLAIVLAFVAGCCIAAALGQIDGQQLLLLIPAVPIAVLGLLDDRHQLDFRWRILVHFSAAALVAIALGPLPAIPVGPWQLAPGIWSIPVVLVILVWATNLYNFMDGIDGLAALECCFLCLVAAGMLWREGDPGMASGFLLLLGASAGFLVWNWPPARIFMGDTGSGFLGFTLAGMALLTIHNGSMSAWSWVLLPGVFIVDATLTVLRRLLAGKAWYQAHSSHAYQHAARRYGHRRVTVGVLLINLLWLLPLSIITEKSPEYGVYYAALGIVPLLVLSFRLRAGEENRAMQTGSV